MGLRTSGPVVFFYLCVCRGPMVEGRVNSKVFVKASIPQGSRARHRCSCRAKDDAMISESTQDLHPLAGLSHFHISGFYRGRIVWNCRKKKGKKCGILLGDTLSAWLRVQLLSVQQM